MPMLLIDDRWLLIFVSLKGDLKTSVQDSERNAVTWGVFPGKEIIQSTIIERESFLTWKVRFLCFAVLGRSFECFRAGRGIFNLDRLGIAVPPGLGGTTAVGEYQRYPLACQCHTS
jgi:hypothetical protein